MLVVLEGLDGSGKSTQVRKMRRYLEDRCGNVDYIHFPRYDAPVYGELISRFLRGDFGENDSVHPQLVALLFAEDRHQIAPYMKRELEKGKTILLLESLYVLSCIKSSFVISSSPKCVGLAARAFRFI